MIGLVSNMAEAGVVGGIEVLGAESLKEVGSFLGGKGKLQRARVDPRSLFGRLRTDDVDLAEIRGQEHAKRALEVAAAGSYNLLMIGPPGSGKTMLARALATSLGIDFKRLQCTPDLLPTDVTGASIFNQKTTEFEFRPGPIFAQIFP